MKRQSAGMSFEICGDELEQHRIELEHNLQTTELSFHISTDDERGLPRRQRQMDSSVEYPRHISEPSLAEYPSFVHRSREHSIGDDISPHHAWSLRTGEDEDGISPFGAETMSTVAHHASAVTISAGLGGGRAARTREPSLSGAEYDPDRPLHAMMNGVNNKLDTDPLKSQQQMTFDPIVVDNTAELDRLLDSGHAPPPQASTRSRPVRLTSPLSSGPSSTSSSPGADQKTFRPKLTDHLRHVSFSPTRPRSAQGFTPTSPVARRSSSHRAELSNKSMNVPTPRPSKRTLPQSPLHAQVRIHPATPSTAGSRFTRMAKGITKDIEATQQQILSNRLPSTSSRPASVIIPPIERNPFHDEPDAVPAQPRMPHLRKSSLRDTTKSRIYLPDVTGLTNAVESPLRFGAKYFPYKTDRPRDNEARLLQTLSALQSQLHQVEEENSISRRRVRELELELEDCKREVMRERTRLIEREELLRKTDVSLRMASTSRAKGKNKARDTSGFGRPELDDEKLRTRYKEAVDEKKALEALVNSLRSHLTRLTAELSSHQELLTELRKLREQDSRALQEKSNEILQLREEVQRLAGEVEVLRGVVEEGLKERRASKESIQIDPEEEGVVELEERDDLATQPRQEEDDAGVTQDEDDDDDEEEEEDVMEESERNLEIFDPPGDKTIRTDRATFGESTNSKGVNVQFMVDEDLDKIAAEVEERRSNLSNGSVSSPAMLRSPSPVRRPSNNNNHNHNRATVETIVDVNHRQHSFRQVEPSMMSRPPAVETGEAQPVRDQELLGPDLETPFPRIRGEHLEKLFFSLPEHNAKTCGVCYRRRDRRQVGHHHHHHPHPSSVPWTQPASGSERREEALGERNGGGGGLADEQVRGYIGRKKEKLPDREEGGQDEVGRNQGLPPQTVVARVIRELEDDFTHYKSVYVELADQYKVMDAVSDVRRRNMLAQHLREVVDILEQKGDQIASLYGVLRFRDQPISKTNDEEDLQRPVLPINHH